MLAIPDIPLTENDELDAFIIDFISDALKTMLLDTITAYESKKAGVWASYSDDMLTEYFPDSFPANNSEQMLKTMKALYSLMISDQTWVPTLLMEYVLVKVIEHGIEYFDECLYCFRCELSSKRPDLKGEYNADPVATYRKHYLDFDDGKLNESCMNQLVNIPFSEEMFTKLVAAYKETREEEEWWFGDVVPDEVKIADCEKTVDNIWHFSREWFDWCFWDDDYDMLNYISIGALRHSYVNKVAVILPEESIEEEYILPKDWKNSKEFRFVNRPEVEEVD